MFIDYCIKNNFIFCNVHIIKSVHCPVSINKIRQTPSPPHTDIWFKLRFCILWYAHLQITNHNQIQRQNFIWLSLPPIYYYWVFNRSTKMTISWLITLAIKLILFRHFLGWKFDTVMFIFGISIYDAYIYIYIYHASIACNIASFDIHKHSYPKTKRTSFNYFLFILREFLIYIDR